VPIDWRSIVAVGVIAGDLRPRTISRFAGVTHATAERALAEAGAAGILVDGVIPGPEATRLVDDLPAEVTAGIHTEIAIHLIGQGPAFLLRALDHAQAAGDDASIEEIAATAEQAGRMSLSVADYESARRLLALADESGSGDAPADRARRLGLQGTALEGLGLVPQARDVIARGFDLAELAGENALAADLAVAYAFPTDWYAGDLRAAALLQRAGALPQDEGHSIAIDAARAVVEMRIPVDPDPRHQTAWVTRASVAQPIADDALARSGAADPYTRLLALLSWRTTHRAPRFLARRREVSSEAVDLAQALRLPGRQIDAALMLAIDSLESGDRPQYERALGVLRWVAERDGNPRLKWHAFTAAAGAAHMDDDLETADEHRRSAEHFGAAIDSPGWLGASAIFTAQRIIALGDLDAMRATLAWEGMAGVVNPIGRSTIALFRALTGDPVGAEADLRFVMRALDEESSLLLTAARAVEAAVLLDVPDVVDELTAVLAPFADHIAVDANGWWCGGPVALGLALLAHAAGDSELAASRLAEAHATARRMADIRSLARIDALRSSSPDPVPFAPTPTPVGSADVLTERELEVLSLLVDGATNPEIARALSYSPSTIRNDVTSIYRKLGVRNRPEAAARARALGLA